MTIQRFEMEGLAQYSYVVSDGGKAVVIDAARDIGVYVRYAAEHQLVITHVVETHIHADFSAGSKALAEATGAELALSGHDEGETYQYAMPHRRLMHGDTIQVGTARLKAWHTPGHTPEHLSYLLFDSTQSETVPVAMFSGDFLFVGSLGRPDLLGEGEMERLLGMLYKSVQERLRDLPASLKIYPGHGAGSLCGANLSKEPESTLGYERETNTLLSLPEAEFLARVVETLPPLPSYYPRMKRLNSVGAEGFAVLPGGSALSVEEVRALRDAADVTLVDLRSAEK
ncbi:MAG: MBL fold metallo-hydrolase, partial [Bryocella sp.]